MSSSAGSRAKGSTRDHPRRGVNEPVILRQAEQEKMAIRTVRHWAHAVEAAGAALEMRPQVAVASCSSVQFVRASGWSRSSCRLHWFSEASLSSPDACDVSLD